MSLFRRNTKVTFVQEPNNHAMEDYNISIDLESIPIEEVKVEKYVSRYDKDHLNRVKEKIKGRYAEEQKKKDLRTIKILEELPDSAGEDTYKEEQKKRDSRTIKVLKKLPNPIEEQRPVKRVKTQITYQVEEEIYARMISL
jgi:hypothetical protein